MHLSGKKTTYLTPTNQRIEVTQGDSHVTFQGMMGAEVAEFLRLREECADGCGYWGSGNVLVYGNIYCVEYLVASNIRIS